MAKFFWGDKPFNIPLTLVFGLTTSTLLGALIARTDPIHAVGDAYPTQIQVRGVAVVTVAYMLMLYMFYSTQVCISLIHSSSLKPKELEKAKFVGERVVGNTLEQAFPFLAGLWLQAIFVNPAQAMVLGWLYIAFRAMYVIFYGFYGTFNTLCELSTQTNYTIVAYFLFTGIFKCVGGTDLYTRVHANSPWLMILFMLGMWILQFIYISTTGLIASIIVVKGVQWEVAYEDGYDEEAAEDDLE